MGKHPQSCGSCGKSKADLPQHSSKNRPARKSDTWSGRTERPGFRPLVRGPRITPSANMRSSTSRSAACIRLRWTRSARVSRPWINLAAAQRARPSGVLGPVERPPCWAHLALPGIAGFPHTGRGPRITALQVAAWLGIFEESFTTLF